MHTLAVAASFSLPFVGSIALLAAQDPGASCAASEHMIAMRDGIKLHTIVAPGKDPARCRS